MLQELLMWSIADIVRQERYSTKWGGYEQPWCSFLPLPLPLTGAKAWQRLFPYSIFVGLRPRGGFLGGIVMSPRPFVPLSFADRLKQ